MGQAFWIHRKLDLSKDVLVQPHLSPGHMMYNNLLGAGDYIGVGQVSSDSSIYLLRKTTDVAWVVASGIEYWTSDCYLMANVSSVSSYR